MNSSPNPIENYVAAEDSMQGKVVLITGAAGGLGSSLARTASRLGCELILLDKNERGLNALYDEIHHDTGIQPGLYPLDLGGATEANYEKMAATIDEVFGKLHGVVHCAANVGQITPALQIDISQWMATFNINVHGPAMLTRALLPLMRQSQNASIIFTLDNKQTAYWGAYGASKAAIECWMRALADELDGIRAEDNSMPIRCNAIDPGKMRTTLRSSAFPGEKPDEVPSPESKVGAFLYLLDNQSAKVNRQVFTLN